MRPEKSLREDWKFPTDFDTKFKSPISVWKTVQTAGSAFNTLPGLLFSHRVVSFTLVIKTWKIKKKTSIPIVHWESVHNC